MKRQLHIWVLILAVFGLGGVIAIAAQPSGAARSRQPQSQPPQIRQSTDTQKPTASDPRGTDESPLVVRVLPTAKTNDETKKEKEQEQRQADDRRLTQVLAKMTFAMAALQLLVLGAQVYIAYRQNRIMETQSGILTGQLQATADAASAANQNALAAKLSADTADRSFQLSSAAYVSVSDLQVTQVVLVAGEVHVSVAYRVFNASPNPLTVLRFAAGYNIADAPDEWTDRNVDETFAPKKGAHFPVIVGPLTPKQKSSFYGGALLVNLFLTVTFIDSLERTRTQEIRRRVVCSPHEGLSKSHLWNLDEQESD